MREMQMTEPKDAGNASLLNSLCEPLEETCPTHRQSSMCRAVLEKSSKHRNLCRTLFDRDVVSLRAGPALIHPVDLFGGVFCCAILALKLVNGANAVFLTKCRPRLQPLLWSRLGTGGTRPLK